MSLDEKLIDKRVVARSLKQGRVDGDEYRRALQELPDLSEGIAREADAGEAPRKDSSAPRASAETGAAGL